MAILQPLIIQGKIIRIEPIYTSPNGKFTKQEVIVEVVQSDDNHTYTYLQKYAAIAGKVTELKHFSPGDNVEISSTLIGKEVDGKNGRKFYQDNKILSINSI